MLKKIFFTALFISLFSLNYVDANCSDFNETLIFSPLADIISFNQSSESVNNLQEILISEGFLNEKPESYDMETVLALEGFIEEKELTIDNPVIERGIIFSGDLKEFFNEQYGCNDIDDRYLITVISNNYLIPEELSEMHDQNRFISEMALSIIFDVSRSDLAGLSLEEIVVDYGEPFLAEKYKSAATGYEEVFVLKGEKATYENFLEKVKKVNSKEGRMDLLINIHGSEDSYLFYDDSADDSLRTGKSIRKEDIRNDLSDKNIGYVYQTSCWGSKDMEVWLDIGAEVVNGAQARNDFVILSPIKFLEEWSSGKSFKEAVESGYEHEKRQLAPVMSLMGESLLDPDSSRMDILGRENYKIN